MARRTCEGDDCNSLTNEAVLCEDCKAIDREPYVVEALAADRDRIAAAIRTAMARLPPCTCSGHDSLFSLLRVVEGEP
jgi:hypothetical protein